MGTSTLDTLLPAYGKTKGTLIGTFSTTATIGAAAESFTATGINDRGYDEDDAIEDFYVRFTSGNNLDEIRRITGFTASTSVAAIAGTLAAESGNVTFELYDRDPQALIDALNGARYQAYPSLHRRIVERSLVGGFNQSWFDLPSRLRNVTRVGIEPKLHAQSFADNIVNTLDCDLEGTTITDDWTASGGTISYEDEVSSPDNYVVFEGEQSGKFVVASATEQVTLSVPNPTNYVGERITVTVWAYADNIPSDGSVKAAVRTDGGSYTVGTAHGGTGWERLIVELPADHVITTSIEVGFQVASPTSTTAVYWDELITVAGPQAEPRLNPVWLTDWRQYEDQIHISGSVQPNTTVILIGTGPLSAVSAGTDTMELDEDRFTLLFAAAHELLLEGEMDGVEGDELNENQRAQTHWRNKVNANEMALPSLLRANH